MHAFNSLVIFILLLSGAALASFPEINRRVTDLTGTLSPAAVKALEGELLTHEKETTNQIVVVIVSSLEGTPIEDYSVDLFKKIQLGQKGKDNGVLFLIAKDDRKMRIEVGYGLEGDLTDFDSHRIIEEVKIHFKQDDFEGGVRLAVARIIGKIKGTELPPIEEQDFKPALADESLLVQIGAFIGLYLFLSLFAFFGTVTPGKPGWIIYFFLMPFYGLFPTLFVDVYAGLIGFVVYLILYPIFKIWIMPNTKIYKKMSSGAGFGPGKSNGWASSSSYSSSSDSWSSSDSSSSDSFSGGGGESGGGGSSGDW